MLSAKILFGKLVTKSFGGKHLIKFETFRDFFDQFVRYCVFGPVNSDFRSVILGLASFQSGKQVGKVVDGW